MPMKTGVFLASIFVAASILSLQGADKYLVPDFVKELDDLGEVMEMAASSNKGITFLLMDPDST